MEGGEIGIAIEVREQKCKHIHVRGFYTTSTLSIAREGTKQDDMRSEVMDASW